MTGKFLADLYAVEKDRNRKSKSGENWSLRFFHAWLLVKKIRLFLNDSFCRTYTCACSALYTSISIDNVFSIAFADSFYWTFTCTCSAGYTFV